MKKDTWPATETELAAAVVEHFQSDGWTVFQEVAPFGGQGGLDILCRRGPVLYAIECKLQFSDHLVEQAIRWRPYAHLVSVAVPRQPARLKGRICGLFGLGVLMVSRWEGYCKSNIEVFEQLKPAFRRKVSPVLREHLERFHVEGLCEAGTAAGSRSTPFRTTVNRLLAVVERAGKSGVGLYEAVDSIDHHWRRASTAYSCVRKYVETGVIKGLRVVGQGREARLFTAPQVEAVA